MAQTFDSKLSSVGWYYLKQLDVKVTKSSFTKSIEENPYYPSLLSLSDTLTRFRVANIAFKIEAGQYDDLQTPFIALTNIPGTGSDFVLVTAITDQTVSYLYNTNKPVTISRTDFVTLFKNVALFAEPDEASGEPEYTQLLKQERAARNKKNLWAAAAAIIILLALFGNVTPGTTLAFGLISIIKLAGLAAALLLLVFDINKNNAFVKNICTAGGKTNCDAVLGSKAAKVFGIGWGEIGFFYFAATTLFLLMPSVSFNDKAAFICIANAFAAPYILFSIYYQRRVVKQWCPLCLTVQAVLAAELVWAIVYYWQQPAIPPAGPEIITAVAMCVLLPMVVWYGLKPLFLHAKDYTLYQNAYKRLQYNPDTFHSQLVQQPKAADNWQQLGITVGNPDAENTIIKVCNPYCGPCARAHPQLEEVIQQNNNINLKIIFTAANNGHDQGAIVVKHLLAVAAEGNHLKTKKALDDWYLAPKKDYEAFATKYPMNAELKQQEAKLEAMSTWCKEAEIMYTPTIFVNGYRLPENYDVEELKHIL